MRIFRAAHGVASGHQEPPVPVGALGSLTVWVLPGLIGGAVFFVLGERAEPSLWGTAGLLGVALLGWVYAACREDHARRIVRWIFEGIAVALLAALIVLGQRVWGAMRAEPIDRQLLGGDVPRGLYGAWVLIAAACVAAVVMALRRPSSRLRPTNADWPGLVLMVAFVAAAPWVGAEAAAPLRAMLTASVIDHTIAAQPASVAPRRVEGRGVVRTQWTSAIPAGSPQIRAVSVVKDTVVTLVQSDPEVHQPADRVIARDLNTGQERWHYTPTNKDVSYPFGGIAIDQHSGTAVLAMGDTAVFLDITTGRDLGHLAFPPDANGVESHFEPLNGGSGYGPSYFKATIAETGPFMTFVRSRYHRDSEAHPWDSALPEQVISLDVSTRTFTTVDQAPSVGCTYWAGNPRQQPELVTIVRAGCGPTKIILLEGGQKEYEMMVPDGPGLSCEPGCDVTGVVIGEHDNPLEVTLLRKRRFSLAGPTEVVAIVIDTDSGYDVSWRRGYDRNYDSDKVHLADLGEGPTLADGCPLQEGSSGSHQQCLLIDGELVGASNGESFGPPAELPRAHDLDLAPTVLTDTTLYLGDGTGLVRYDSLRHRLIDRTEMGCSISPSSVTTPGTGDDRIVAFCPDKMLGLSVY